MRARASEQRSAREADLEMANRELREQAVERELQIEELQATIEALAERADRAERARDAAESRLDALGESESKYRALFDSIDAGLCVIEVLVDARGQATDYRFLEANPAFVQQSGLVGAIGRTAREVVPQLEAHWIERYGRVAATGEATRFQSRSEATGRWFDGYAFRVGQPEERRVAVLFSDVSVAKAAERERERLLEVERELRVRAEESERRFRETADAAPVLIWTARTDARRDWFNEPWLDFTGRSQEQEVGDGWLEGVHPDDRQRLLDLYLGSFAARRPFTLEYRLRRHDGEYRWLLATSTVRVAADGTFVGFVGTCVDVTDQRLAREAAEAAREQLQAAFAQAPAAVAVTEGPQHRYVLVNDRAGAIAGRSGLVGRTFREAFPELEAQGYLELLDRVYATGAPFVGNELPVRLRAGTGSDPEAEPADPYDIYVDVVYQPLRNVRGEVFGIMQHVVDVSERVLARQALEAANAQLREQRLELERSNAHLQGQASELEMQAEELQTTTEELAERTAAAERAAADLAESEARLRLAAEAAQLGTWSWDLTTDAATFDWRVRELFGFEQDEPWPRAEILATRVHPEDRDRVAAALAAAADPAGDGRYAMEYRVVRPDGSERWVAATGVTRFDGEGAARRPVVLIGTAVDVTERRRAETALAESKRQLRTLADAIPTLAWTARADGYIEWYNARWYEYTGTTPEEMAGWGWERVHDPAVLPQVLERWRASIASGQPTEMTFPLRGGDGRFRRFLTRITPLTDADGRVVRWFGTSTDVEAERAAREAAEAANRAKSDFLAVMSHELRTPLNAIGGYAELLELGVRGPVTAAQIEDLARIQKAQRHLLGLINAVLNYTRVEAGGVHYVVQDVVLDEALATCETLTAPQLRAKRLEYLYAGCDPTLVVRADPEKLQQIMLNLLSNAVKFTDPGGRVTLACGYTHDMVAIHVSDTGRGIPADQRARVFEPFVQIDARLTRTQEGVGLGLAISRDLARGMGGDLTVESEVGAGSTFTLRLPRAG